MRNHYHVREVDTKNSLSLSRAPVDRQSARFVGRGVGHPLRIFFGKRARSGAPAAGAAHGSTRDFPSTATSISADVHVILTVTVDSAGRVENAVVASSGGNLFDDAAIAAIKQWAFSPATRDGTPILLKIHVPFVFHAPAEQTFSVPPSPSTSSANPARPAPAVASPSSSESTEKQVESPTVIVVTGDKAPSRGVSDFTLPVASYSEVPRKNSTELLTLAPGIFLSNEGGDGHAEQVFLRGFDAREGQDIEFTVGGVPINEAGNLHGNGYANTHFIIPEVVQSLRVLEGPYDPRQGNFAVAGSADYQLGLQERGTAILASYGSFNTERLVGLWGPEDTSPATFAAVEMSRTDGYGQNRDSMNASAMGQWEHPFANGIVRLTATALPTDTTRRASSAKTTTKPAGSVFMAPTIQIKAATISGFRSPH